jgi:hypothetical protein
MLGDDDGSDGERVLRLTEGTRVVTGVVEIETVESALDCATRGLSPNANHPNMDRITETTHDRNPCRLGNVSSSGDWKARGLFPGFIPSLNHEA